MKREYEIYTKKDGERIADELDSLVRPLARVSLVGSLSKLYDDDEESRRKDIDLLVETQEKRMNYIVSLCLDFSKRHDENIDIIINDEFQQCHYMINRGDVAEAE